MTVKDGWHKLHEYYAYIQDGKVMFCSKNEDTAVAHPYKPTRVGWVNMSGACTLEQLRHGIYGGRWRIL